MSISTDDTNAFDGFGDSDGDTDDVNYFTDWRNHEQPTEGQPTDFLERTPEGELRYNGRGQGHVAGTSNGAWIDYGPGTGANATTTDENETQVWDLDYRSAAATRIPHRRNTERYKPHDSLPHSKRWRTHEDKYERFSKLNDGVRDKERAKQENADETPLAIRQCASQLGLRGEVVDTTIQAVDGVDFDGRRKERVALAALALVHDNTFKERWEGREIVLCPEESTIIEKAQPISGTAAFTRVLDMLDLTIYRIRKIQRWLLARPEFTFDGDISEVKSTHDVQAKSQAAT